jgi:hypothetical protein
VIAWLFRLIFSAVFAAVVWLGLPYINDFRAVEFGVAGTMQLAGEEPNLHGTFVSRDGHLRRTNVPVAYSEQFDVDAPDTVPAWLVDDEAPVAYVTNDWAVEWGYLSVWLSILAAGILMIPARRPRRFPIRPGDEAQRAARSAELGDYSTSRSLAGFGWAVVGVTMAIFGVCGLDSLFVHPYVWVVNLVLGALCLAAVAGGVGLVRQLVKHVGQRVHIYERGVVVSRGRSVWVYPYARLQYATVPRSEAGARLPGEVTLHGTDGRKIEVDGRVAAEYVIERLPPGKLR